MLTGATSFAAGRCSSADGRGRRRFAPLVRGKRKLTREVPLLAVCVLAVALCSCSILPNYGPSALAVRNGATGAAGGYSLVELDPRAAAIVESAPLVSFAGLAQASNSARVDLVGVGDSLNVTVIEQQPESIFGAGGFSSATLRVGPGLDPAVTSTVPKIVVDSSGDIALPYAGGVHVAGLTTTQAAQAIQASLRGKAIDPQVMVGIVENIANSVTVTGDVHGPGRYPHRHCARRDDGQPAAGRDSPR